MEYAHTLHYYLFYYRKFYNVETHSNNYYWYCHRKKLDVKDTVHASNNEACTVQLFGINLLKIVLNKWEYAILAHTELSEKLNRFA